MPEYFTGTLTLLHLAPHLAFLFLITVACGTAATRLAIYLSHRLNILDKPDGRKAHGKPVAYLGGFGMLLGFLAGIAAAAVLFPEYALLHRETFFTAAAGGVAIFFVGFWDDIRPIRAMLKLLQQIAVASAMWYFGLRIEILTGASGAVDIGTTISYLVTIGWYVALMNSINLVDGLDGLAGGISFLGAASLVGVSLVINFSDDVLLGALLATITAGTVLAFLFFNWHPAKIFMGDGGSLLLGFLLATSSLVASTKTPTIIALCVPLVALGLPLFETTFSFTRRILQKKSPFKPDRRHLHHRLLDLGLDQRRVVVALLFATAFLGVNSVILAKAERYVLLFNIIFIIGGLILLIENLRFLEKRQTTITRQLNAEVVAGAEPPAETVAES